MSTFYDALETRSPADRPDGRYGSDALALFEQRMRDAPVEIFAIDRRRSASRGLRGSAGLGMARCWAWPVVSSG